MKLCFFYGSLRSGYWNNGRCVNPEEDKLIGLAKTTAPFRLFINTGHFVPVAVPAADGYPLVGELWELCDNSAMRVHHLENGYKDAEFEVTVDDQAPVQATIYFCDKVQESPYHSNMEHVVEETSGDYAELVINDHGYPKRRGPVQVFVEPIKAPVLVEQTVS